MKKKFVVLLVALACLLTGGTPRVHPTAPLKRKPAVQQSIDAALILVNANHPLPASYQPELAEIGEGFRMEARAAAAMIRMRDDAMAQGVPLLVCSAYRSRDKQQQNFNQKVDSYVSAGLGMDESVAATKMLIAVPGTSEHESGFAADIVTPGYQLLNRGYAETAAAKWLAKNAPSYGFILRYPDGKTDVTGISFEPWHYRYVGAIATDITESGLTLEEYLGQTANGR